MQLPAARVVFSYDFCESSFWIYAAEAEPKSAHILVMRRYGAHTTHNKVVWATVLCADYDNIDCHHN